MEKQKKLNFRYFMATIIRMMDFDEMWDDEKWNQDYICYKEWLSIIKEDYKKGKSDRVLIQEWAKEYLQDLKMETHSCQLKPEKKSRAIAFSPDCG